MAYRGEDLDLRTPHARSIGPADANGNGLRRSDYLDASRENGRPIMVDETVLAACNYAHEVAAAHRAAEVRLEHLVYALTRIETTIPVLEDRVTRLSVLRAEISGMIASSAPVSGVLSPRKSDELESVLRYASDLAQRRGVAAASVEDVLFALAELRPDNAAVIVLRRHMPRRLRDTSYIGVRTEAPPLIRNPEPTRTRAPAPLPATEQILGTTTDSIQNTRIDQLEQALRQLSSQLAGERKSMALMLQDIQRDIGLRRDDDLRLGGGVSDRFASIEASIDQRLGDLTHIVAQIQDSGGRDLGPRRDEDIRYVVGERVATIEASLEQRLGDLARAIHAMQDRLAALDSAIQRRPAGGGGVDLGPLQDRIANVERIVQVTAGDTSRGWATVADRIKTMEAAMLAQGGTGPGAASIGERLEAIERVLQNESSGYIDTSSITGRLEGMEQLLLDRLSEPAGDTGALAERLKAVESVLATEIGRISGTLRETGESTERRIASLVGAAFERQRAELVGTLSGQTGDGSGGTQVAERLGAIERSVAGATQKLVEQSTTYDQDLGELQDVLIKLHTHQQSISGALDQWRQQGQAELGTIGNRLSALERVALRPAQMIEAMSTKLDAIYQLNTMKIERRNRFVYWLFGTDDWLAASWPERRRPAPPQG